MYCYFYKDVFRCNENINIGKQKASCSEKIHIHDFIEMVYILSGSGSHIINQVEYKVKKGDLLFINYGQTHSFQTDSEMEFYNVLLKPEFFGEELINSDNAFKLLSLTAFEDFRLFLNVDRLLVSFAGSEIMTIEFLLKELFSEFNANRIGRNAMLKAYMMAFITAIFRKMSFGDDSSNLEFEEITPNILEYIEEHYNEKISLQALAKRCFYNSSYFSRLFKELYGMTLTDFIQQKRIEKSCEMLRNTKYSVNEICFMVGYNDKTHFYKYFKEFCATTPALYRKSQNCNTTL